MAVLPSPQQLRYLTILAEYGHFGRAATACGVTQSTLSAGVLALERQLDAAILDRRSGRRLAFTPVGEEIVALARQALSALGAVADAASESRGPACGSIRLGIIPTIAPFLLPWLLPAARRALPALRLSIVEDVTDGLLERLAAGRLDLLLLAMPCACDGIETLALGRDPLLVALPPGHRLGALGTVPVGALQDESLLLLGDGHCLRGQALGACRQEGTWGQGGAAGDRYAATGLHTLVQMVENGLGVTLLPRLAADAGLGAGLVLRPVAGAGAWRTVALGWRRQSGRADEFHAVAALLAERLAPERAGVEATAGSAPAPAAG